MNDAVEEIKSRVDVVDLISETVKLKKSGHSFTGFCPFHSNTRTPAFVVWPETGTWKCFGSCNISGDIFSYVMKRDGIEFRDALDLLARRAGVELKPLTTSERKQIEAERKKQDNQHALLSFAADLYSEQLWNSPDAQAARDFVTARGFTETHLRAIRWGWSDSKDTLKKHLVAQDKQWFQLSKEIGLIRSDGLDFTANADGKTKSPEGWIVYPHVEGGKVVFFSARAVNRETRDKSRNLPGNRQIYRADYDIREEAAGNVKYITPKLRDGTLVIVEGPSDAESLRAWGFPAWAMCGAPVADKTDHGKRVIGRLCKRSERDTLYAAMSNDKNCSGLRFAYSFSETIGPLTRIVIWPKEQDANKSDANDLLKNGASSEDIVTLLENAQTYLDCYISDVTAQRDPRKKAEGIDHLAGLVARLGDTERSIYINEISDRRCIGISKSEFVKLVSERMPHADESAVKLIGGKLFYYSEPIVNANIRIEKELTLDDGQNLPRIQYHMTGVVCQNGNGKGHHLSSIDVDSEELDSTKWLGKYWGARVIPYIGNGKSHLLKRAILELSQKDMTQETVYTFTGWYTVKGKRAFLTSSGALTADGLDTSARVDLPNNLAHYSLPVPPTGQDLASAIRASLDLLSIGQELVTVPLWLAMWAATLTDLKPLMAVLWPYGQTQSKKSAVGHLFLSLFGERFIQDRDYKSVIDWTSTAADIEATMFTCKDVPLVIDDYAPQFTGAHEAKEMGRKAHYVVRSVGNRSSRGRRKVDMTARDKFIPRGLVLSTAELPLIGEGIEGRLITVPFDRNTINTDRLTIAQRSHNLLSRAMSGFITWRLQNFDMVTDLFTRRVTAAQEETRDGFSGHDRLGDYFAVLSASSRLVLHWMAGVGAISDDEESERATLNDLAVLTLLSNQHNRISEQSPVLKFFRALEDLLLRGKCVLAPKGNEEYVVPSWAELIGWRYEEQRLVYLLTSSALTLVKEYYAGIDEPFSTLKDALQREIWQFKLLKERDDEQLECSKYINKSKGNVRVLVIDPVAVYQAFKVDLLGTDKQVFVHDDFVPVRQ